MKNTIRRLLFIACLSISLHFVGGAVAHDRVESLRFVSAMSEGNFTTRFQVKVMKEAMRRNGLDCTLTFADPAHSVDMMRQGVVDGELLRRDEFNDAGRLQEYVKIDAPIMSLEWFAYIRSGNVLPGSWEDLIALGGPVGFRNGCTFSEVNVRSRLPERLVRSFDEHEQGFEALKNGDIAAYIMYDRYHAKEIMESKRFMHSVFLRSDVLGRALMTSYLHARHKELAPTLAKTIRQMESEGLCEKYLAEIMLTRSTQ